MNKSSYDLLDQVIQRQKQEFLKLQNYQQEQQIFLVDENKQLKYNCIRQKLNIQSIKNQTASQELKFNIYIKQYKRKRLKQIKRKKNNIVNYYFMTNMQKPCKIESITWSTKLNNIKKKNKQSESTVTFYLLKEIQQLYEYNIKLTISYKIAYIKIITNK
ncbi:unnamed protein product [Paramecium sonneborni]|uniref:Uncharacterized protein n=1 Tax=Paramecium sonneborni TaxID=65129 RepID=A0A8S1LRR6_9CILI|nr:unnamed protein product [Paramecium sonneborni]